MRIVIREGLEKDSVTLAKIAASTFALACPPNTLTEDLVSYINSELTPTKFVEQIQDAKTVTHVAEVAEEIVGYCALCFSKVPLGIELNGSIELKRLYILPEFHGVGVAQKLMQNAIAFASKNGYKQLWLSVSGENQRAIAFYRKSGFMKVGEQKFYVGNDIHDDHIMMNQLPIL